MSDAQKYYPHSESHKARGDWNPLWEQIREIGPDSDGRSIEI